MTKVTGSNASATQIIIIRSTSITKIRGDLTQQLEDLRGKRCLQDKKGREKLECKEKLKKEGEREKQKLPKRG